MKVIILKFFWLLFLIANSIEIYAQFLSNGEITEIKSISVTISESQDWSNAEWSGLSEHLEGKRIVSIGEFTHGAQEIFEMQNSLIQYLVDKQGFDVVLFESGIGELIELDAKKEELSASELTSGFFGGWRNQSRRELMQFLRDNLIDFSGFDPQRFGGTFYISLKQEGEKFEMDDSLFFNLENRFVSISRDFRSKSYDSLALPTLKLIGDWTDLSEKFVSKEMSPIVLKAIENRVAYLQYFLQFSKDKDWNRRFAARDSLMANNAIWLMENIYTNRKVVILGHNYHISRHNEKILTMGQVLDDKFGDQMIVFGSYAMEGTYAGNSGDPNRMESGDSLQLDIKHIMSELDGYCQFLTISKNTTSIFNQSMIVNDTFVDLYSSNKMDLSRHFDGLILLKKISMPIR